VYLALPNPKYSPTVKIASLIKNKLTFITQKAIPDEEKLKATPENVSPVKKKELSQSLYRKSIDLINLLEIIQCKGASKKAVEDRKENNFLFSDKLEMVQKQYETEV